MTRFIAIVMVMVLVFSPTASAKPVFDCSDPVVRRNYPAQCPELRDPLLTGGGHGGAPGHCGGLCGIIDRVLGGVGLGGLL